jgi:DNA-binding LytR/AlgR family response regulator
MMMKIKVLIIEDEKIFADNLEQILNQIDTELEVIGKIGSVQESVQWLSENTCDLIFLDIQLSDGISFEIFNQIEIDIPVIFITSYDQYAIDAFKLNSLDYLLKPVNINELKNSIIKYKKSETLFSVSNLQQMVDMMLNQKREYKKRFMVHVADKIKSISTAEIAFFFILDRNTFLCTNSGAKYDLEFSLDKIEGMVDPTMFFRVNRQYIINFEAIENMFTYSKSRIKVEMYTKPKEDIIVSLSKTSDFRKWLSR